MGFAMRALLFSLFLMAACATTPPAGDILADMRALEVQRGAAICADDETALLRIYAEDFQGVTAMGVTVTRAQLFAVFARAHAQALELAATSRSEVLTAKREGNTALVIGRLHFGNTDSMYTHVFRWRGDRWELFAAAASPMAG
jgi:ketosteroid isomerase-like protein